MQKISYDIIVFFVVVIGLIVTMILFLVSIVYLYRKKQKLYGQNIQDLTLMHEKALLDSRLEIQEETFQHISREIHDNINLSLTLAKLHLNTLLDSPDLIQVKIENSINLLTKSISELSNISKTLNAELIIQQGLVQAVEEEVNRIMQATSLKIELIITGEPIYLSAQKELIIFRIIQEAFNNIIKHSGGRQSTLVLNFGKDNLEVDISDTGKGFNPNDSIRKDHAGLRNISNRAKILGGSMKLQSERGKGTLLIFKIPYQTHVDR